MKKKYAYNVGSLDQQVRYALGFLFPVLSFLSKRSRLARAAMWIIGIDGLLTAYFQFSPLNRLLGISSYKRKPLSKVLRFAR